MVQKYYAVKKGRQTGIFLTWPECQKQVSGFKGAQYKSFASQQEAKQYLSNTTQNDKNKEIQSTSLNLSEYATILYTDGGSRNHGNKAGQHVKADDKAAWAYLIKYGKYSTSDTGAEYGSTNNRMEIMALKKALERIITANLQNEKTLAILDSKYVLDSLNKGWLSNWQKNNWKTANGQEVKNKELWQEILRLLPQFKHITFKWTKGHADDPGNVFVDKLLNETMDKM